MTEFGTIMQRSVGMLAELCSEKRLEPDSGLDELQAAFESCISAIEYERECRDTARQAATSHSADINNAVKI